MPYLSSPVDGAQLSTATTVPRAPLEQVPQTQHFQPLIFLRGWLSSSLMFESLMLTLCEYHHFHCIQIDRCGFGNSDWTGSRTAEDTDYDMSAEDVAFIVESLNLDSLVFLGASMGCRERLQACSFSSTVPRQVQRLHLDGPFPPANLGLRPA